MKTYIKLYTPLSKQPHIVFLTLMIITSFVLLSATVNAADQPINVTFIYPGKNFTSKDIKVKANDGFSDVTCKTDSGGICILKIHPRSKKVKIKEVILPGLRAFRLL